LPIKVKLGRVISMARWKIELHLPMLVVGAEDIRIKSRRRRRAVGPYLIISRVCGFALDAGISGSSESWTTLYTPHAERQQLWHLCPTGIAGEFAIVSAAYGLALDATQETSGDIHPHVSEATDEPWQRWRLEDAPDGAAYLIQSAHSRRYLTVSDDTQLKWSPWFEARHAHRRQQWILAAPYGRNPV
jgi:Ricin-type beta-trefoil lectin domain-like